MFRYLAGVLLTTLLMAAATPKPFAAVGDPLYGDIAPITSLMRLYAFKEHQKTLERYLLDAETAKRSGFALQKKHERQAAAAYIEMLRELEKRHQEIDRLVKTALLDAIDSDRTSRYRQIMSTGYSMLRGDPTLLKASQRYQALLKRRDQEQAARHNAWLETPAHLNGSWETQNLTWRFKGDSLEVIKRDGDRLQRLEGKWKIDRSTLRFSVRSITNERTGYPKHQRDLDVTRRYAINSLADGRMTLKEPEGGSLQLIKQR